MNSDVQNHGNTNQQPQNRDKDLTRLSAVVDCLQFHLCSNKNIIIQYRVETGHSIFIF